MNIVEKDNCFLLDGVFSESVIAGFTKPILEGHPVRDASKALAFFSDRIDIAHLKQIHSATIHQIQRDGLYQGDGLFTKRDDIVLVVRTADCLPLFFYSDALGILGVVHMGWKGARSGILDSVVDTKEISDLSTFKVVAGVGMRSCCYEVGNEFLHYHNFTDCLMHREQKLFFDPISFAKKTLLRYGLLEKNFLDVTLCSFCDPQKFFSYRRDATTFRTLSFIVKHQ